MRNLFLAGLALVSIGVSDGFAAVADTSRADAGVQLQASESAARPMQDPSYQNGLVQEGYPQDGYYAGRGREGRFGVRVWLDDEHDVFRPGERTRVLVRATEDAYLAVIHIDPRGDVEFLWPRSHHDDGYVQGGRLLDLGERGSRYLNVGGVYGIGYVFAVASDEPLDVERFRDYYTRRSVSWDRRLNVYGDPFYAMERFERMLVPDYGYGYHASDWYSYHVGTSRYRFPRYACYSDYGSWYTSGASYYDGCDHVWVLLRESPYYYDTRYYHGDRSRYYRRHYRDDDVRAPEPRHRYKEGPERSGSASAVGVPSERRPSAARRSAPPPSRVGSQAYWQQQQEGRGDQEGKGRPQRERPTLQRRPPDSEPSRSSEPRQGEGRARETPRRDDRARERERETPRERSAEPRRESPPPRSVEPRRESPPSRDEGGRSTPSERSAPRVRPSAKG